MKNAKKKGPQKGEKRKYVREALQSLGLDANFAAASKWIKDKYGAKIGDPTFYHTRKEVRQEQAGKTPASGGAPPAPAPAPRSPVRKGQPTKRAAQAPAAKGMPAPAAAAAPRAVATKAEGPTATDGVAALVTTAKNLVERLGKDEAKRLIDAL